MSKIPEHVAIIADGNRRWARSQGKTAAFGHQAGCETLLKIVEAAADAKVKVITFFLFSTENWKRDPDEVETLFLLFKTYLQREKQNLINKNIRLHTIGYLPRLPQDVQEVLADIKEATKSCNKIDLVFALNYGGRDEITRAIHQMCEDVEKGAIKKEEIDEERVSRYLDTAHWPDPDLLIRTSGEMRISNFLLWQLSYSEIYLSDRCWPDFTPENFKEALADYQMRERRVGGA